MRVGNDSFTMGEGKTVQADKPESPKTWENPSNMPEDHYLHAKA